MEWSEEEKTRLLLTARSHPWLHDATLAVADLAVELAAARDEKTLDPTEVGELRERAGTVLTGRVLARLSALGARNAVLEAERERLQGELGVTLKRADAAETRVRQLAIAGQELSAAVDKHVGAPPTDSEAAVTDETCDHCAMPNGRHSYMPVTYDELPVMCPLATPPAQSTRYPCSPTCIHDDAVLPGHAGVISAPNPSTASNGSEPAAGHAERVTELGVAVNPDADSEADQPLPEGSLGERVKERGEHHLPSDDEDPMMHEARSAAFDDGHAAGAEAMRAACLREVLEVYRRQDGCVSQQDLRAAIEGAAP